MSRNLPTAVLVLSAAAASAQNVNTQISGLSLTNGLTSITDASALTSTNQSVGIGFLTDNDTSTYVFNAGYSGSGSIQGTFGGTISSSATGIYIVGTSYKGGSTFNGTFSIQLQLLSGLTSARTYGDNGYFITGQVYNFTGFQNAPFPSSGATVTAADYPGDIEQYAYLYVPLSDFSATYDQVVGIKLGNFTNQYLDVSYIGIGYGSYSGGGGAVPEPSTYGLALGGLALVGAVIRRRKISK